MSLQINNYLFYGYRLDYKEANEVLLKSFDNNELAFDELLDLYHDNQFSEEIVEVNGCSMISDGMDGEYVFFGKVLSKSKDHEQLETQKIKKPKKAEQEKIEREFNRLFNEHFADKKADLYFIAHYR